MNHLAFHGGPPATVDAIMADATAHGWTPLYQHRYPYAGGANHYAGWLENSAGFKAEIVAERRLPHRHPEGGQSPDAPDGAPDDRGWSSTPGTAAKDSGGG